MVTQRINSQTASLQPIAWHPDILRAGPGELSQSINTWSRLRLVGSFCRHPLYHRHPAGCRVDREEEIKPWSRIRSHHQTTELNCCNVQGASRSSSGMDAYHHRSAITVCQIKSPLSWSVLAGEYYRRRVCCFSLAVPGTSGSAPANGRILIGTICDVGQSRDPDVWGRVRFFDSSRASMTTAPRGHWYGVAITEEWCVKLLNEHPA